MQQTTLEQRRQFQQHALNTAAPERNQRISHELQIRLLERAES